MTRRRRLTASEKARRRAQRERLEGLDADDAAARWLANRDHDHEPEVGVFHATIVSAYDRNGKPSARRTFTVPIPARTR